MRRPFSPRNQNVFAAVGFRVSTLQALTAEQREIYFRIKRGTLSAVERNNFKRVVRQQLRPHLDHLSSHVVFHVGKNQMTSPWEEFIKGVRNDLERFLQTHGCPSIHPTSFKTVCALGA